jgi:hypothetical protein
LRAGLIFVEHDLRRLRGNANILRLHLHFARVDANPDKRILDLLDRRQHCLAVGGDVRLIDLAGRLDLRRGETPVEQRLRE